MSAWTDDRDDDPLTTMGASEFAWSHIEDDEMDAAREDALVARLEAIDADTACKHGNDRQGCEECSEAYWLAKDAERYW